MTQNNDHERIWLQHPKGTENQDGGRMWCEDKVWPINKDDGEPTEYVRQDIHASACQLANTAMEQNAKLKTLLHAIISDVKSMQARDRDGSVENWFVGFSEWTENPDDPTVAIEWPNLSISVGNAETYLKELEG